MKRHNIDKPFAHSLDNSFVLSRIHNFNERITSDIAPTTIADIEYTLDPVVEKENSALSSHIGQRVVALAAAEDLHLPYLLLEDDIVVGQCTIADPEEERTSLQGVFRGISLYFNPSIDEEGETTTNEYGVELFTPQILFDIETGNYTDTSEDIEFPLVGHADPETVQLFFAKDRALELATDADVFLKTRAKESLDPELRNALGAILYGADRTFAGHYLHIVSKYIDQKPTNDKLSLYDDAINVVRAAFPPDTPLAIDASYFLEFESSEGTSGLTAHSASLRDVYIDDIISAAHTEMTSEGTLALRNSLSKHYFASSRDDAAQLYIPLDAITRITPETH